MLRQLPPPQAALGAKLERQVLLMLLVMLLLSYLSLLLACCSQGSCS